MKQSGLMCNPLRTADRNHKTGMLEEQMQPIVFAVLQLIGLVGIPALIATAITLFCVRFGREYISERMKAQIKGEYDAKLEQFKADLKISNDRGLEHYKHELSLQAINFNLRNASLYEKRALVIADVYAELEAALRELDRFTNYLGPKDENLDRDRVEPIAKRLESLRAVYYPNRIFLPIEIDNAIGTILEKLYESANNFDTILRTATRQERANWGASVRSTVTTSIKPLLKTLEATLRDLMGDQPSTKALMPNSGGESVPHTEGETSGAGTPDSPSVSNGALASVRSAQPSPRP